jgi:hypothetical protein
MIAVFISYRQLQVMLRRPKAGAAATAGETNEAGFAIELVQLTAPTHPTPQPSSTTPETSQLLTRIYTFQEYICISLFIHLHKVPQARAFFVVVHRHEPSDR